MLLVLVLVLLMQGRKLWRGCMIAILWCMRAAKNMRTRWRLAMAPASRQGPLIRLPAHCACARMRGGHAMRGAPIHLAMRGACMAERLHL